MFVSAGEVHSSDLLVVNVNEEQWICILVDSYYKKVAEHCAA